MATRKQTAAAAEKTGRKGENPLLPNRVLLQMYRAMLAAPTAASPQRPRRSRPGSALDGLTAPRAAVAVSLRAGDLVSSPPGSSFAFHPATLLPGPADPAARVSMAVGAGLALRLAPGLRRASGRGSGAVAVCLIESSDLSSAMWRQTLRFVAEHEVPLLLIVAPGKRPGSSASLQATSTSAGVPAFPVDAEDAVAMYRVIQESLGRLRAGDGPVLIQAVRWQGGPDGDLPAVDRLRAQLIQRGLAVPERA